jgi:hypothetical protein
VFLVAFKIQLGYFLYTQNFATLFLRQLKIKFYTLELQADKYLRLKNPNKPDLDRPPMGIELTIVG